MESEPERGNDNRPSHRKRRRRVVNGLWSDYTKNTTLHGLKYTTEKGLHLIEKIFWMLTFLLSCGLCLWLIRNVWHKWQSSPVIVSFSEKIVPVELVPFPSLTICPQIKSKLRVYNYTKNYMTYLYQSGEITKYNYNTSEFNTTEKLSDREMKLFLDVSLICPLPFYLQPFDDDLIPLPDVTNHTTVDNILEVSPDLEYFLQCSWLGEEIPCYRLFSKVLTEEGVCFNFNGMAGNEIFRDSIQKEYQYSESPKETSGWDFNTGYNNSDDANYTTQYPYRSQYDRQRPYLEVYFMTSKKDMDENCNVINKGYKVYTQHPASHPQSSVYSYAILPGQLSALALKVNMMNTSEKLKQYDAEVRQCYFSYERYLRYFQTYTASNCLLECMSNYTYKSCACVPFHMPHVDSTSICTLRKSDCLSQARALKSLIEAIEECDCLPNCNSITYEAEILKSEFQVEKSVLNFFKISKGGSTHITKYEYSKLEVYYRDSGFVTITRSELFGVTDFLANIGGLLGLFVGFSFLSVVEIVYFFTIRLGYTCRRDIKHEKDPIDIKTNLQSVKVDEVNSVAAKVKDM